MLLLVETSFFALEYTKSLIGALLTFTTSVAIIIVRPNTRTGEGPATNTHQLWVCGDYSYLQRSQLSST